MDQPRGKMINGGLFILLLLCLALPALPAAAASGIGFGPPSIDIIDAMRGASYENSYAIFNTGDRETGYIVTTEGEAAAWLTFTYLGKPFDQITVPAGGKEFFEVTVTVPTDAANRKYTSRVTITSVPISSSSGTGVGVSLSAYSDINITVTGTQKISGNVNGVTVKDQETGFLLLLQVFFENTGNVKETPSIDVTIDWDGKPIDSFNYSKTEMGPSEKDFIDVNWDTTGRVPGDYTAHVTVSLDGQQIYTQDVRFKVLALGSLTRSGELGDMRAEGTLLPGKLVKINGVFTNTGAATVMAKLTGEIFLGDDLVEMLEGDEILVDGGRQATLSAYFTPQQEAKYTVKAQADFGGKKTDIVELTLNIITVSTAENDSDKSGNSSIIIYLVIGGAALVLIIVGIVIVIRRRRD